MGTTTVHIPDDLLFRIDQAAQSLGVSRNKFVLSACVEALARQDGAWPEGFFDRKLGVEEKRLLNEGTREMEQAVLSKRTNRGAPAL